MLDYIEEQRSQSRKKRQKKTKVVVLSMAVVAFISAGIGVVRAPLFLIEDVVVRGNRLVDADTVAKQVREAINNRGAVSETLFPNDSALLAMVANASVENIIQTDIPTIKSIHITTNLFKKQMEVRVSERDQYGVWCARPTTAGEEVERCWWFDSEGVLFMEGPATQGGLIRKVLDVSDFSGELGKRVLEEKQFAHLREIFLFLEEAGLPIKNLILRDRSVAEIETNDPAFPTILFSLRLDPVFATAGIQKIIHEIDSLEYIDLRTKNRVYYK